MGELTGIQWCDHTFNPWRGCTKISEGCAGCYAEVLSRRNPAVLGEWGPSGARVVGVESYWRNPVKWNRQAAAAGVRRRVFCASLGDVFEDNSDLIEHRQRLWRLIAATPHLDWLLLTKRPKMMLAWGLLYGWPTNAWAGVSVENQRRASERLPYLRMLEAPVRFVSVEPQLGPVNLQRALVAGSIDWVIVGGESGTKARPFHLDWARTIRDDCANAGAAFFMKQIGSVHTGSATNKGGGRDAIPVDLYIRQFPVPRAHPRDVQVSLDV